MLLVSGSDAHAVTVLICHWLPMSPLIQPGITRREQSGRAAGVHDQQTAVAQLRDLRPGEALGQPFLDPLRSTDQIVAVHQEQLGQLLAQPLA